MIGTRSRLLLLVGSLVALLLVSSFLYMVGMKRLEGEERTFLQALEFVSETLSTTGYGKDSAWRHPVLVIFVITLQFVGVFLVFLIFPIYLIPFLEQRFEFRLPKAAPALDEGTVLIYRSGPAVSTLLDELARSGVPSMLIEGDSDEARRLLDEGRKVVVGTLDDGVLNRINFDGVRALVANGTDDEDAAAILSARQLGFEGEIVAVVEEPFHRKPMVLAGADAVFTPRHVLGAALAARASERLNPRVIGVQALGRKLVVSEVRVRSDSELVGRTLAEAEIGRRYGVTIIGQWVQGHLYAQPTPDMQFSAGGILIVAGSEENVQRFAAKSGRTKLRREGRFVIAGYGEVGQKVVQLLQDADEMTAVIDRNPGLGIEIVGDVMDPRVLEKANVEEAQAVILAVDNDSSTLFSTVILKDYAPQVPVIARVNQAQNVERIHRAGADFALSISQVSGQILAGRLLGQESIAVNKQLKVLKVSPKGLEGKQPSDLEIRAHTGCSVVAVERGDEVLVDLSGDFTFGKDDQVYICGSVDATQRYLEAFPQ